MSIFDIFKKSDFIKCPRCRVKMDILSREGITIDKCSKCEGIWLDKGELKSLIELSSKHKSSKGGKNVKKKKP